MLFLPLQKARIFVLFLTSKSMEPFCEVVGYKSLLPKLGSHLTVTLGESPVSNPSTIVFKILSELFNPFSETIDKSSALVWYSGYSPNFDLQKVTTGRSISGEQNCLSSEPLSKKEYFLTFFMN